LVVALSLIGGAVAALGAGNVVRNSSFEVLGDDGKLPDLWGAEVLHWAHRRSITGKRGYGHGGAAQDAATGRFGQCSLKVTKTGGDLFGLMHDIHGLEAGATYTLSGCVKVDGESDAAAQIAVYHHTDQFIAAESHAKASGEAGDWERVSCRITIPGKEEVGLGQGYFTTVCCQVAGAGKGVAWFDGLQLVKGPAPVPYDEERAYLRVTCGPKVTLATGGPRRRSLWENIFYTSEQPYVNLRAVAQGSAQAAAVRLEVRRAYPEASEVLYRIECGPAERLLIPRQEVAGAYGVDASLLAADGAVLAGASTIFLVILPRTPSTNPDASPFEAMGLDLSLLTKLGLSHHFVAPRWRDLNPAKGKYLFDRFRAQFDSPARIRNHYMVVKTPNWAADRAYIKPDLGQTDPAYCPPADWDDWDSFVIKLFEEYKGLIHYLEVNAEQEAHWYGGPESYCEYLKRTYELVKRIEPAVKVVYGGVSPLRCLNYIEESLKCGVLKHCDILATHLYMRTWPEMDDVLTKTYDNLDEIVRKHNNGKTVPVWNTEINYPMDCPGYNAQVLTEEDFAAAIVRVHAILLSRPNFKLINWWGCRLNWWKRTWRNGFIFRAENFTGWRAVSAFFAYANMTAMLSPEPEFVERIHVANDPHQDARVYVFRRMDGRLAAVVWRPGKETPIELEQGPALKGCEGFDINGNVVDHGTNGAMGPIGRIGPMPRYLLFEAEQLPAVRRALAEAAIEPVVEDSSGPPLRLEVLPVTTQGLKGSWKDKWLVPVRVHNRSDEAAKVRLNLRTDAASTAPPVWSDVTVEARDAAVRRLPLMHRPEGAVRVDAYSDKYATIDPVETEISYFVCPRLQTPPALDGKLDEWQDMLPFHCNRPEQVQITRDWQGVDDLSAVVYTAWDKDNFYLAAKVLDDNAVRTRGWIGDAVQMYFCLEDPKLKRYGYGRDLGLIFGMEKDGPRVHLATKGRMENLDLAKQVTLGIVLEPRNIPFPDITYYEMAIPWTLFQGFQPDAGQRLGFNIVFNDSEDGKEYRGSIGWTEGIVGAFDPGKFEQLRLAE